MQPVLNFPLVVSKVGGFSQWSWGHRSASSWVTWAPRCQGVARRDDRHTRWARVWRRLFPEVQTAIKRTQSA